MPLARKTEFDQIARTEIMHGNDLAPGAISLSTA